MRIIDLPKIPQDIHRRLEQRSNQKTKRGQTLLKIHILSSQLFLCYFVIYYVPFLNWEINLCELL